MQLDTFLASGRYRSTLDMTKALSGLLAFNEGDSRALLSLMQSPRQRSEIPGGAKHLSNAMQKLIVYGFAEIRNNAIFAAEPLRRFVREEAKRRALLLERMRSKNSVELNDLFT